MNNKVELSINTLPDRTWFNKSGMRKGLGHDRQHLGIILSANKPLRIRQINNNFTSSLTLRLLNDDRLTEKEVLIGHDWVTITNPATSVPFIDTPYIDGSPVIEYEYPTDSSILPVYRKDDDETEFFKLWDEQRANFALIDSKDVVILVPVVDKEKLRYLDPVKSAAKNINELLSYYDSVMTSFDRLSGLSVSPDDHGDLNIGNRYFIKADKNGYQEGYYGNNWTAQSSDSVANFWLHNSDRNNWGSLHEIAHGYHGNFMESGGFSVKEVWNNIYAATYQRDTMGERVFKDGWLYMHGKPEELFNRVMKHITEKKPLNEWGVRLKLYFMMLMKDKAGDASFTYFNQQYRKNANDPGFVARNIGCLICSLTVMLSGEGLMLLRLSNMWWISDKMATN